MDVGIIALERVESTSIEHVSTKYLPSIKIIFESKFILNEK